jgi:hypothetical protein
MHWEEGFRNWRRAGTKDAEYGINNFKLDVRSDDLDNIAFVAESFDVVTLFDV